MTTRKAARARGGNEPLILRVIDRLGAIAGVGAGIALIALLLNIVVDVIVRALAGRSLGLTLELTTFWWMPLLATLAYAITEQGREHITVTILLDRLSRGLRRIVEGSFSAIGTVVVALLAWFTFVAAMDAAEVRQAANSVPPLEYWHIKILAAVGLALLALQMAASTYRILSGRMRVVDQVAMEGEGQ